MENKSNVNESIMAVNGLRYKMQKPLSTTLVNTHKKQYSQSNSYKPGQTIVFDINSTGAVDPQVSYLKFTLSGHDQAFNFGFGTCLNLFSDVRLQSKNGTELDRIQKLNQWAYFYLRNIESKEKLEHQQTSLGYNENFVTGVTYTFMVPLEYISCFFKPHQDGQKIPPQLMSGCRLEIQLENAARATVAGAGLAVTDYTISQCQLILKEHVLNDNTLKMLNSEAQNGLEYVYSRVFTASESSANTSFTTQIKKAVSQATHIITQITDPTNENKADADSFRSVVPGFNFSKFQYRLGSNYFPHSVVDNIAESSILSMSSLNQWRKDSQSVANTVSYLVNDFHVSQQLKSDHNISSSGLAVNNSSVIALEYEGTNNNKTYHSFLIYTCLARCFLNQTTVKI